MDNTKVKNNHKVKVLPSWNTASAKSMNDLYELFTSGCFLLLSSSLNSGITQSTNSSCVQSRIVDGQKSFWNNRMFDFRTSNILKQVNPFLISCSEVVTGSTLSLIKIDLREYLIRTNCRAFAQKKSICARKLVQNLRWKRLCAKFNTRENYFI